MVPASLPRVDFFHWVLIDLRPTTRGIARGEYSDGVTARGKPGPHAPRGRRHGINDYTGWFAGDKDMAGDYYGYDGPCPPWNDELPHRYVFTLYALDVPRLDVPRQVHRRRRAHARWHGHVLAQASVDRPLHAQSGGEAASRTSADSRGSRSQRYREPRRVRPVSRAARSRRAASSQRSSRSTCRSGAGGERRPRQRHQLVAAERVHLDRRRRARRARASSATRSGVALRPSIATQRRRPPTSPARSAGPAAQTCGSDASCPRRARTPSVQRRRRRRSPGLPPRSLARPPRRAAWSVTPNVREQLAQRRILGAVDVAREEVGEIAARELARERSIAVLRHADPALAVALPQRAHHVVERRAPSRRSVRSSAQRDERALGVVADHGVRRVLVLPVVLDPRVEARLGDALHVASRRAQHRRDRAPEELEVALGRRSGRSARGRGRRSTT